MNGSGTESAAIIGQDPPNLDFALLRSVARQLMTRRWVRTKGQRFPVRRTSRQYFKIVNFLMNGREYAAIEQNAAKPSYWSQLARKGHQVVQFKDLKTGHYVAVAVDGVVTQYHQQKQAAEKAA